MNTQWCCEDIKNFYYEEHLEKYEYSCGVAGHEFRYCPFCGKRIRKIILIDDKDKSNSFYFSLGSILEFCKKHIKPLNGGAYVVPDICRSDRYYERALDDLLKTFYEYCGEEPTNTVEKKNEV